MLDLQRVSAGPLPWQDEHRALPNMSADERAPPRAVRALAYGGYVPVDVKSRVSCRRPSASALALPAPPAGRWHREDGASPSPLQADACRASWRDRGRNRCRVRACVASLPGRATHGDDAPPATESLTVTIRRTRRRRGHLYRSWQASIGGCVSDLANDPASTGLPMSRRLVSRMGGAAWPTAPSLLHGKSRQWRRDRRFVAAHRHL